MHISHTVVFHAWSIIKYSMKHFHHNQSNAEDCYLVIIIVVNIIIIINFVHQKLMPSLRHCFVFSLALLEGYTRSHSSP